MTFAALRRATLQAGALSVNWFGEQVTRTTRAGATSTITVKIEVEAKPKSHSSKPLAAVQSDTKQRIRVMISREPSESTGGIAATPDIGEQITRAAARDSDTRPWVFAGEVVAESELHAIYVYERSKRPYDDRRTEQA